ncbi:MAG TPA: hypothetical protein VF432_15775 [Thermoanaerobaculia bacterium]
MSYVPNKPLRFQVNGDHAIEAVGPSYDRDELELGFQALESGLQRLQFTVGTRVDGEHGPQLSISFPVRRTWQWEESTGELVLQDEDAGTEGDELELVPAGARTWQLRWLRQQTIIAEIAGDAADAPQVSLWNRATTPKVEVYSLQLEPDADRIAVSGRIRSINAPPLNHPFLALVSYAGLSATAVVDSDGELKLQLPRPPSRSATMRFTMDLPVVIDHMRIPAADSGDLQILTHFGGATVATDDSPSAEFRDVIPAGRMPVAIKFERESYRPAETALTLTALDENRVYRFRAHDDGAGRYRLDSDSRNAGLQQLLEDQLEVRLDSQTELAGRISVIPQTMVGHWRAKDGSFEWHPYRVMSQVEVPRADDPARPQLVDYRGMRIAVDPTAFEALLAKDPLAVFSNDEIAIVNRNGKNARPRLKEYECVSGDNPLGKLEARSASKFAVPADLRSELRKQNPVIVQSADGAEQGLLWVSSTLRDFASYQRVATDAIDGVEGRPGVIYFRGIYFIVVIRKVASGPAQHSMIEVQPPLVFPRHLQVEPFLPLMTQVTGNPPDRVLLWQFGEEPVQLDIRSDGILAGPGVGYVFRPIAVTGQAAESIEWFVFPPASNEAEVVYCTWRGFLLKFDATAGQVQFAGWFLPNGEMSYPKRAPFDSYRFARKRESTSGTLCGADGHGKDDWQWSESSTICEEDRAMLAERVRSSFKKIPKSAEDLVKHDARERVERSPSRSYVLQPVWSMSQQSLHIKVTEQPVETTKQIEAVRLFIEKKS